MAMLDLSGYDLLHFDARYGYSDVPQFGFGDSRVISPAGPLNHLVKGKLRSQDAPQVVSADMGRDIADNSKSRRRHAALKLCARDGLLNRDSGGSS